MLVTATNLSESSFKETSYPFIYLKNPSTPDFRQALYRNSRVHRLTVDRLHSSSSEVLLDQWYTIHLKVVTEMGLPTLAMNKITTCQLLSYDGYCFKKPGKVEIDYRLIDKANVWQTPHYDGQNAFESNSLIQIQYRISGELKPQQHYYLYFESQQSNRSRPLSLCVGPFCLSQKQQVIESGLYWDETISTGTLQTFRALPLASKGHFIMLQEIWENGTQGKLWDSALVMIQIVNEMIHLNKDCLNNLRIMDLSAGIGCLGLSIAKNCEIYQVSNPPTIVLTDLEEALNLMKNNQHLNLIGSRHTQTHALAWGSKNDAHKVMMVNQNAFDFILVSDVLYNTSDFPALISTFQQLIDLNYQKDLVILMGYKPRGLDKTEEDIFFDACKRYLHIESIGLDTFTSILSNSSMPLFNDNQILEDTGVCLYKITKKHIY